MKFKKTKGIGFITYFYHNDPLKFDIECPNCGKRETFKLNGKLVTPIADMVLREGGD